MERQFHARARGAHPATGPASVARATDEPVLLEVASHYCCFTSKPPPSHDPWQEYNPERVKRSLAESAGAFHGMDTIRHKRPMI